jgi:uncharacterized OsmC-like protein
MFTIQGMARIAIAYEGGLRTSCVYLPTGQQIKTDAPIENKGKGSAISPTDLVGAALGSCILTLMAIQAEALHVSLAGAKAEVSKEMSLSPPRRIAKISVLVTVPHLFSEEIIAKMEKAARNCPVHHSLHPDIVQEIQFHWSA